jgi:Cu(I)/Ag(I) efflux system protein CusF
MMNKFLHSAGAALAAAFLVTAVTAQEASISGEVRKIDGNAGKITLKHGPARSLGMDEGMTMAYRVKDPAMLKQVKVGDQVTFEAENADGGFVVTKLQKAK